MSGYSSFLLDAQTLVCPFRLQPIPAIIRAWKLFRYVCARGNLMAEVSLPPVLVFGKNVAVVVGQREEVDGLQPRRQCRIPPFMNLDTIASLLPSLTLRFL
jgi:hypothetical protein